MADVRVLISEPGSPAVVAHRCADHTCVFLAEGAATAEVGTLTQRLLTVPERDGIRAMYAMPTVADGERGEWADAPKSVTDEALPARNVPADCPLLTRQQSA